MANDNVVQRDLFGQPTVNDEQNQQIESELPLGHTLSESLRSGRYAEFMVCAFLSEMGHQAFHVNAAGFDLILEYQGFSYRVEVKSSNFALKGPHKERVVWKVGRGINYDPVKGQLNRNKRTRRPLIATDVELLALFYRPLDTVVFYPVMKPISHVLLPLSFVRNAGRGEATLGPAIKKIGWMVDGD